MRTPTFMLFLAILCMLAATAQAERPVRGTIGLYLNTEDGNELSRAGTVKVGEPFEIVVRTETESVANAVVFQMTELNLLYPGVFKVSTWRVNDSTLDQGDNDNGEYAIAYGACLDAGELEVVRVGYADVNGDLDKNVALHVHGIPDDEVHAPYLDGAPGYVDCSESYIYALEPEPWVPVENFDPTIIQGLETTNGLLVLNPQLQVPVGDTSVGELKGRF